MDQDSELNQDNDLDAQEENVAHESQDDDDSAAISTEDTQNDAPAALSTFLDELTDTGDSAEQKQDAGDDPAAQLQQDERDPSVDDNSSEDMEEAELLAGVNSERGRERLRQIFAERREAKTGLSEIREVITEAGVTPEALAEYLEFSRHANSDDPNNLLRAAKILDHYRDHIYKQLGVDAPGVDGLSEYPDLAQAVEGLQISKEHALEIAKARRQQTALAQQQNELRTQQQEQQEFALSAEQGKAQMVQFLSDRQNEIDHAPRMRAITEYFSNPAKVQEFARTYQPHQWAHALSMMYEGIKVAPVARRATPSPLSARTASLGQRVSADGESPEDRTLSILNGMGL